MKYRSEASINDLIIHVIEDPGYNAMYYADCRKIHLVFSSKLAQDWNEIDIESTILYLLEVQNSTLPIRDTCILVLATIAERFIITSVIGASLIHLVRSHSHDYMNDQRVAESLRYTIGYKNTLLKLKAGGSLPTRFPASFGMNGIVNITTHYLHSPLYDMHEPIDSRIEEIGRNTRADTVG